MGVIIQLNVSFSKGVYVPLKNKNVHLIPNCAKWLFCGVGEADWRGAALNEGWVGGVSGGDTHPSPEWGLSGVGDTGVASSWALLAWWCPQLSAPQFGCTLSAQGWRD